MELTKVSGHKHPQGVAWNPSLKELLTPKLQVVDKKEFASGTLYAKAKDNYRKKENMSAKDVGRFFYDFSCSPDREDDAYFHALGGMPLIPDTQNRVTNKDDSSSESGVVQRNISLTKEVGRLVQEYKHKPTVIREALAFNEKFNPPLDPQEAMTVINSIWKT